MPQKNRINLLPPEISEKIAAGEVVDRPFSIVKELVENSIDANADNIVVDIKSGGKTYIRVSDNGTGIPANEAEMAFSRHATSKIEKLEDLNSIGTLGFRGEALTSIAAVSKIELITKTNNEKAGIRLLMEGGRLIENSPAGCPDGTTIIVRDIFYNTPARLKFLKTDASESSLIIDFVSKMALAYPSIRFRMINNDSVLFATRGKGSIYDNILTIYSKETSSRLIEIDEKEDRFQLLAYISPPDINRANRRGQVYFVNGRSVRNKVLESAVADAYRERLAGGRSPLIYLFLQVPQNSIDVNIHPNKKEVRFEDNKAISEFVTVALMKGLKSVEGLSNLKMKDPFKDRSTSVKYTVSENWNNENNTVRENEGNIVPQERQEGHVDIKSLLYTKRHEELSYHVDSRQGASAECSNSLNFRELKPMGSIFATYILASDEFRFYLIDQHAAHERIFYEKLLNQFSSTEKNTQLLITPIILDISPAAASSSDIWTEQLSGMGFQIEPFGIKTFLVKGIPSFMDIEEARKFLENFIDEMGDVTAIIHSEKLDKIITKACKSAIKANNLLNMEEIRYLLKELGETGNPFSCPHGRPTILMLSKQDIERLFKRA